MLKHSVLLFFFVVFSWGNQRVSSVMLEEKLDFYEKEFYEYVPKKDWLEIKDIDKKQQLVIDFTKQMVGVVSAKNLGLQHAPKTAKKLDSRFRGLVVNEYYMRSFLGSLVKPKDLAFCKKNLKKEVFVKHILFPLDSAGFKLALSIKQDLKKGASFEDLAIQHSLDPSVQQNNGALGWVGFGLTVPEFQNKIFTLCVGCLDVVETSFGYHVVKIDSTKLSQYNNLDKSEYDDWAFRFSTAYIEEELHVEAAKHDSSIVKEKGVFISRKQLQQIISQLEKERLGGGKQKSRREVDALSVVESFPGVVATYNGDLLGAGWFVNNIKTGLYQKNTYYESVDQLYNDFMRTIIRDIVFDLGLNKKINNNPSFIKQFNSIERDVLYKDFLSWLINNVNDPSKEEIEAYYKQNDNNVGSLEVSFEAIKAILLQEKQKEAQNLFEENIQLNININMEWLSGEN